MSKQFFISLCFLSIISTSQAQTDKGDWMVGGNMIINTTQGNKQFVFQPSGGYFFAKNFVAGAMLTFSVVQPDQVQTTTFGLGPYARYYFDLKNATFKPFLESDLSFGTQTRDENGSRSNTTINSFFLGAGGAFFINSNVALEAVAGMNRSKVQSKSPETGFLFRFGFQVHLLNSEVARLKRH